MWTESSTTVAGFTERLRRTISPTTRLRSKSFRPALTRPRQMTNSPRSSWSERRTRSSPTRTERFQWPATDRTPRVDFFICIGDQPELDFGGKRNGRSGIRAFDPVVKGMDVVKRRSQAEGQTLKPPVKIVEFPGKVIAVISDAGTRPGRAPDRSTHQPARLA